MTAYNPGDVLLVAYPFGERAGGRKRPVVVISTAEHNELTAELIVAQITNRISAPTRPGDSRIAGWREANLPAPALARARLATLEASLVLRRLGRLTDADLGQVRLALSSVMLCAPEKALS